VIQRQLSCVVISAAQVSANRARHALSKFLVFTVQIYG